MPSMMGEGSSTGPSFFGGLNAISSGWLDGHVPHLGTGRLLVKLND